MEQHRIADGPTASITADRRQLLAGRHREELRRRDSPRERLRSTSDTKLAVLGSGSRSTSQS